MDTSYRQKVIFVVVFAILGFIALQVPFSGLAGSKVKFTLFDFFGPLATGFIGTIPGIVAVLAMQVFNFFLHGAAVADVGTIIRFFPMLFAAFYFGRKRSIHLAIPLVAIIVFNAHPIGRSVWYYSLFWIIPLVCYFLRDRFLFARALGATFTAHAVGGAAWIWAFALSKSVWVSLIPVVVMERLLFAAGIAASYLIINNLLAILAEKKIAPVGALVNQKYVYVHAS